MKRIYNRSMGPRFRTMDWVLPHEENNRQWYYGYWISSGRGGKITWKEKFLNHYIIENINGPYYDDSQDENNIYYLIPDDVWKKILFVDKNLSAREYSVWKKANSIDEIETHIIANELV